MTDSKTDSTKTVDIYKQLVDSQKKEENDFLKDALVPQGKTFQSDRIYCFNQTGNFLISSTFGKDDTKDLQKVIPKNCWQEFSRAAVFLAAMTKAMALGTKQKKAKSLYDYDAIANIINKSGLWIQMTEEEVNHQSDAVGADFSTELIQGLLGLMLPEASIAKFSTTMMQSMGKEAVRISGEHQTSSTKLANMIIVCENLFGVPFICMILVNIDSEVGKTVFNAGPCISGQKYDSKITMTKQVYYWVSPESIERESATIIGAMQNKQEAQIVRYMMDVMSGDQDPSTDPAAGGGNQPPANGGNKTPANGEANKTPANGGEPTKRQPTRGGNSSPAQTPPASDDNKENESGYLSE